MRKEFLSFATPLIEEDEIQEVLKTLKSGWLTTGPKVSEFQNRFAEYKQVSDAVALGSCTAAIHLSLLAAGIGRSSEVITTPLTFCATINAIIHSGATPILADIDPRTMNIDPNKIEAKITPKTKAILPVHFAGRPCDMQALQSICKKHDLVMIEDCAHAIESEYRSRKIGTLGDFGCFSFYVTKNLVTGEGGMVIAKSKEALEKIKVLSLHGMSKAAWYRFGESKFQHYDITQIGFKYNMTDIQASIGIHQLKKIEKYWIKRKQIWDKYNKELQELPIRLPYAIESDNRHSYHLYNILVDEKKCGLSRDDLIHKMISQNIGVGVHYTSIPEYSYYQNLFDWDPKNYPNAYKISRQTVSLPLSAKITEQDAEDVISALKNILQK